jgi:3-dehydroquinate dehydratase-2
VLVSDRTILLLSGPNLNLLGEREPEIYGRTTLEELVALARSEAGALDCDLEHLQSNAVHGARGRIAALVVNAGALTHYGWSLHDALAAYDGVVVELHLSNPQRRESWRSTSVVAPVADGVVAGFGPAGYPMAVRAAVGLLDAR